MRRVEQFEADQAVGDPGAEHFIALNNRVMDRFTAEERTRIGVHTCPGGDRDSVHSADVPYSDLLPSMFGINAGYFLIQLASSGCAVSARTNRHRGFRPRRRALRYSFGYSPGA